MNVLFLDIDGVLNSNDSVKQNIAFVNHKCTAIDRFCKKYNFKIVISSDWRFVYSLQELTTLLSCSGITKHLIKDMLQVEKRYFRGSGKGYDIDKYINENEIKKYIILDDLPHWEFLPHQEQSMVRTNMVFGLTKVDLRKMETLI